MPVLVALVDFVSPPNGRKYPFRSVGKLASFIVDLLKELDTVARRTEAICTVGTAFEMDFIDQVHCQTMLPLAFRMVCL